MLKPGDTAPGFALPEDGNPVHLATSLEAKLWQVVYVYPMASTSTVR